MIKSKKGIMAALLLATTSASYAQNESDFYTPSSPIQSTNLVNDYGVDNDFSTDDSVLLQQAINDINASGGGVVNIPAGNYSFAKVKMKSNVTLAINSNATIRPTHVPNGNYTIFDFGNFSKETVKNASIVGVNGQFTVDLRHAINERVFVFTFSRVENFNVENVYIQDKNTIFQSFGLGHTTVDGVHYVPKNGLIKNAHAENTHYGYGLVQIQAGKNILFKNISGSGGVTLRLESGWSVMNKIQPESLTPKIDAIYARNVVCKDGQAALFLMPHTIKQGFFDVRDVTADSCEFAVKTEKGWVNQNLYAGLGLTEGSFSSQSIVDNVKSTYGDTAEVRAIMQRFIPCELRNKINPQETNEGMNRAPAVAAIGDFAAGLWRGEHATDPGSYKIQYSNIQASGYLDSVPAVMDGDYCDHEQCPTSAWIPFESKGTFGVCGIDTNVVERTIVAPLKTVQIHKRNAATYAINGGSNGANGQNVVLSNTNENDQNQQWLEIDRGNGYYSYQKVNTNFCLDGGKGGANGQNVYLWKCSQNNHNQHWLKVDVGNGYWRFAKRNAPEYSIDGGIGGADNQNIYLWSSRDTNHNQNWSFTSTTN